MHDFTPDKREKADLQKQLKDMASEDEEPMAETMRRMQDSRRSLPPRVKPHKASREVD